MTVTARERGRERGRTWSWSWSSPSDVHVTPRTNPPASPCTRRVLLYLPPTVTVLHDHMLCPSLERWLITRVGSGRGRVRLEGPDDWSPPRRLHKLLERLEEIVGQDEATSAGLGAWIRVGSLFDEPSVERLTHFMQGAGAGRPVIELAVVDAPGLLGRLRPIRRKNQARRAAVRRLARWQRAGLAELEQWVAVDPVEVVVTFGQCSVE